VSYVTGALWGIAHVACGVEEGSHALLRQVGQHSRVSGQQAGERVGRGWLLL
jgi:hypothetical protein